MNAPLPESIRKALESASLDDKYSLDHGRAFMSGVQALVRLPMLQRQRDLAAGLNTGGFISGYRGSPLGMYDNALWGAKRYLKENNIHFQPGLNEDLAATAVWGSQEATLFEAKVDGVFGLWYSKGPGIDRSGDALRHANLWGTSQHGGVIMAVGDDPMSRSSSIQQQSEHTLAGLCIPVFYAANVQDIYDYGLLGWQLSRYAGVWVGIKSVSDIYESWYPVDTDPARNTAVLPTDHTIPAVGVHTRWPDRSVRRGCCPPRDSRAPARTRDKPTRRHESAEAMPSHHAMHAQKNKQQPRSSGGTDLGGHAPPHASTRGRPVMPR